MFTHRNYTTDSIEELYEGVQEIGTPQERAWGAELLSEHDVCVEPAECAELRQKMLVLLASADWHYQFTPEAEVKRKKILQENLGLSA